MVAARSFSELWNYTFPHGWTDGYNAAQLQLRLQAARLSLAKVSKTSRGELRSVSVNLLKGISHVIPCKDHSGAPTRLDDSLLSDSLISFDKI